MGVYLGSTQVDMQGGFVTGGASGASLQSKTVSPSESAQTVKADNGYDGLSQVTVNAVSKTYVGSGVTKKSAATYTPGTSDQSIASGQYLNGTQTIKGDSNLTAGNIRSGVKIFNVTGSYAGSSSSGGVDTSDATATAANILSGKTAYVNGSKLTGTMTNNGAVSKTMTANGSYTIPAGYHNGSGKVTVNVSSSSGSSNNNIEAYAITNTNPSVSFKRTDGAIKIWGYGTMTSSSGWGGQTTSLIAFEGDRYYKSASWGSPSSTSLSLSISNGKLSGLPSELSAISAIVTRGI